MKWVAKSLMVFWLLGALSSIYLNFFFHGLYPRQSSFLLSLILLLVAQTVTVVGGRFRKQMPGIWRIIIVFWLSTVLLMGLYLILGISYKYAPPILQELGLRFIVLYIILLSPWLGFDWFPIYFFAPEPTWFRLMLCGVVAINTAVTIFVFFQDRRQRETPDDCDLAKE